MLSVHTKKDQLSNWQKEFDWSKTPLKAMSSWPSSLATAFDIMLLSYAPMLLIWGPEQILIYNDACIPILGSKHPGSLGQPAKEIPEALWLAIVPLLIQVEKTGKPALSNEQLIPIERNSVIEECYFTASCSPIGFLQDKIDGTLISLTETTGHVLAKRRLQILHELNNNSHNAQTVDETCKSIFKILTKNSADILSASLYLADASQNQLILKEAIVIIANHIISPLNIALSVPENTSLMSEANNDSSEINLINSATTIILEPTLAQRFSSCILESLKENKLVEFEKSQKEKNELSSMIVLPINSKKQNISRGAFVLGINPLRPFDEDYRRFVELLTGQIATSISLAVTFEEEQRLATLLLGVRGAKDTALRRERSAYHALTSGLMTGIIQMNVKGEILYLNPKACDMIGLTDTQIKMDGWIKAIHIEDREAIISKWQEALNSGLGLKQFEYRYVHSDHSIVWAMSEIIVQRDEFDNSQGVILTMMDITHLKKLEAERLETLEKINEYLKQRADQAERRKREHENFIDILCHELRNPLNGAYGYLELLKVSLSSISAILSKPITDITQEELEAVQDELSEHNTESLSAIELCLKHNKVIINDVLDLSHLDAKKINLQQLIFNPKDIINNAITMFQGQINNKKIKIELQSLCDDFLIQGDPDRLSQILINLLANALKFTEEGNISLTLNKLAQISNKETIISIKIKDTGIGMTLAQQENLFQRFSQTRMSDFQKYSGSGLGLAICKELVELMGGTIAATSTKGAGSEFIFTIKARYVAPSIKSNNSDAALLYDANKPNSQYKILIAEDNKVNQRMLQKMLKNEGYNCEVAGDGLIALNLMKSLEFQVIIMDISMPNMDGLEATKAIRKNEKEAQKAAIPIIGLSGNAREEQSKEAIDAGMNAYLTKPLDKKLLFITLQKYLNQNNVLLPDSMDLLRAQRSPEILSPANDEQKGKDTDSPSFLMENLQIRLNKSVHSYNTQPTTASSHDATADLSVFQQAYTKFTLATASQEESNTKGSAANTKKKASPNY